MRHLGRRDEMTGTPYLSKHPPSPDKYALTDHMVRPEENGWRDCEGESLRGLQVDDQLELAGSSTGRSAGLAPLDQRRQRMR